MRQVEALLAGRMPEGAVNAEKAHRWTVCGEVNASFAHHDLFRPAMLNTPPHLTALPGPMSQTPTLASFRRIVVKVGSSLLVDAAAGALKRDWLASLAADIAAPAQR